MRFENKDIRNNMIFQITTKTRHSKRYILQFGHPLFPYVLANDGTYIFVPVPLFSMIPWHFNNPITLSEITIRCK